MKKLSKTGIAFFSALLLISLILSAVDCANIGVFIMIKVIAVILMLVSGEFLIDNITK